MVQDLAYDDIKIGQKESMTKTITEADVILYAGISGDFNPVHLDKTFADNSMFKSRIAHGMLSAGLISAVIGTALPGRGTIYMGQNLKFLAPVRIGDTVTATVECIEKVDEKHRLRLKTTCTNQDGVVVIDGEALVLKK